MTNGTSQGLFVVVAIVIFGIFVGLTYTLFGSEGLSNDLENIFSDATEQSTKDLKGLTKGDESAIYSQYESSDHFVFDFNRTYKETGLSTGSFNGIIGSKNSNGVYALNKEQVLLGKVSVLEDLGRIYMTTDLVYSDIKNIVLTVNNVAADISVSTVTNENNITTYYISLSKLPNKFIVETNKLYKFKLTYIMENNTYYEFEKSLKIIE